MTLRNPFVQLVDFKDLDGCIESNSKFAPSDIDMIYERNGHFLIGEWKKPEETLKVNSGQDKLLQALANNDKFTVLKIIGYSDENRKLFIQKIERLKKNGVWEMLHSVGDGVPKLREIVKKWYSVVDNVQK